MKGEASKRMRARKRSKRMRARKRETVGIDSRETPFNRLPDECILEIFSYNPDPADRWSCAAVSKKWLILQAHMNVSDFKLEPRSPSNAWPKFTRCLEGCTAVDTRLTAMVVSKCSKGRIINLSIRGANSLHSKPSSSYTDGVTDYGLHIVGSRFPYLKSLALWGCHYITCRGLAHIAEGCSLLEKLDLCECPLLTDDSMPNVANKLKNLVILSIDSCQKIGNDTLKAFGSYTPTLGSVSVVGCPLVGDEGFPDLVDGLPNLKRLKLGRVSSNICVVLENVRKFKGLSSLALEDLPACDIKENKIYTVDQHLHFKSLAVQCSNLKSVSISKCSLFDDNCLLELTRAAVQLERLTMEACNRISLYGLAEFLAWHSKNLKFLTLVKCKGIVEPRNWAIPQSPPNCNSLESLSVRQCSRIRDGFFKWMGNGCCHLHEVELIGMGGISDDGLLSLVLGCREGTPTLDSVWLSGCIGLTDLSVLFIVTVFGEKLKSLGLGRCPNVSSQCLEIIATCCTNLLDLDLSEFEITDDELVYLDDMTDLLGLSLKGSPSLSSGALESLRRTRFGCDIA